MSYQIIMMTFVWKYGKLEHCPLRKFDGAFHFVEDSLLLGYGAASIADYPDISRDEGPLKMRALHRLKRRGSDYPLSQRPIPVKQNSQVHHC